LQEAGILLLNQAVLLKGVNNRAITQIELCETLFKYHTLPYYLHQLDTVSGAAHFAVHDSEAISIYRQMQAALPGYLLPRLVKEVPGDFAKQLLR
jgi:L-lysine 2,3-aminomutase